MSYNVLQCLHKEVTFMDSKIVSIRLNEFDQEYIHLLKEIFNSGSEFKFVNDSEVIRYALQYACKCRALEIRDSEFNDLYVRWKDLDRRHFEYLLK